MQNLECELEKNSFAKNFHPLFSFQANGAAGNFANDNKTDTFFMDCVEVVYRSLLFACARSELRI